jgi:hypothetical protein
MKKRMLFFLFLASYSFTYAQGPAGITIAQAHAQEPLWTFLAKLPFTYDAQIFYALLLGGLLGMVGHYLRRWGSGEIAGSLLDYMVRQHPRATLMAAAGIVTELAGEVGTGLFTTTEGAFVGWALVILSGIKTGYLGDSIANKGVPKDVRGPDTIVGDTKQGGGK